LENFPHLKRLHTLLLHNNRIAKFQLDLQHNLPHLEALVRRQYRRQCGSEYAMHTCG
jgi:hypothetical protein